MGMVGQSEPLCGGGGGGGFKGQIIEHWKRVKWNLSS